MSSPEYTDAVKEVGKFQNVYTPETAPDFVQSGAVLSEPFVTDDGIDATYGVVKPGTKAKFPADERGERLTLQRDRNDVATELYVKMTSPDGHHVIHAGMNEELPTLPVPGGWEIELNHPEDAAPAAYICEYTTEVE